MDRSTIKKRDLINLERVGEGSQGVLFRAQWLGQQVIYKQMKQLTSKEGEEKNAFVKEFEAWKYDLKLLFSTNMINSFVLIDMPLTSRVCHCTAS